MSAETAAGNPRPETETTPATFRRPSRAPSVSATPAPDDSPTTKIVSVKSFVRQALRCSAAVRQPSPPATAQTIAPRAASARANPQSTASTFGVSRPASAGTYRSPCGPFVT